MNLDVEIAGWKRIKKDGLPPYFKHRLLSELTYDNPAYTSLLKHRKNVLIGLYKQGKAPPKKLYFWREDAEWYYVPQYYDLGATEHVLKDYRVAPAAGYPKPLLELRNIQIGAAQEWETKGRPSGIFIMPTGAGKTIFGIEIARRLGVKTIVLTGRDEAGIKLWMNGMKDYLGIVVGRIQGDNIENLDSPVTVATVQSLWSKKDLLKQIAANYGLVIYDEAQHVPAQTFCEVVSTFRAQWRIGVTATEKRNDGLEAITFAVLGPTVFERRQSDEVAPVRVKIVRLGVLIPQLEDECRNDYNKSVKLITAHDLRNSVLIDAIARNGQGRHNLIVTHRVRHAKLLANLVVGRCGVAAEEVGVLVANPKQQERRLQPITVLPGIDTKQASVIKKAQAGDIKWIFATYQYAGEGLDIPILDTLHMATPSKNEIEVTQGIGRVRRAYKGKQHAQIFDYVDTSGMFHGFFMQRCRIYKKLESQARRPEAELVL